MDKEGILSLPNPCAEKVFFLKSRKQRLKEELAGQVKERKESVCTWTSETSRVSSSQDGQESISDDEDDDDDISASVDDSESVGKIYYSPAGSIVTKDQVVPKKKPIARLWSKIMRSPKVPEILVAQHLSLYEKSILSFPVVQRQKLVTCGSQVSLEKSPAFRDYRQEIFSSGPICILDVKMNCV